MLAEIAVTATRYKIAFGVLTTLGQRHDVIPLKTRWVFSTRGRHADPTIDAFIPLTVLLAGQVLFRNKVPLFARLSFTVANLDFFGVIFLPLNRSLNVLFSVFQISIP